MAQSYVTEAGTLIIPGAYATYKVQTANSGLATTGVIMLVGEAESGPDFSLESDLEANAYGPDQLAQVVAKYKAGPLVDAFRAGSAPANDPDIVGAPSRFIMVKTNVSTKASLALSKVGGGTYATFYDKSYGKLGNLIFCSISNDVAEVIPTTGSFTFIPPTASSSLKATANGAAIGTASWTAAGNDVWTPTEFVAGVDGLAGVAASGGAARAIAIANPETLTGVAAGNVLTLTYSGTFGVTPVLGDTLIIPNSAPAGLRDPAGGTSDDNVGAYVVTSATTNSIVATKLSDAGRTGGAAGVVTAPRSTGGAITVVDPSDIQVFSPVTITVEGATTIEGIGKSLEIADGGSTENIENCLYVLGTTNKVSWLSKAADLTATTYPQLRTSASERKVKVNLSRAVDGISEELMVGGDVVLRLGYKGACTTATCVITDGTFKTQIDGVDAVVLSLADFPTVNDLVAYLKAESNYVAEAGTAVLGQMATTALDDGTFGIRSINGALTGRIKADGYKFHKKITEESVLVQLGNPSLAAACGLPAVTSSTQRLSGGVKGATTAAKVQAALDALEKVRGNFLVPLFSRDAAGSGGDIERNLTDSGSTYVIASIHAAAKSHCLKLSTLKRRRNRQAFLAIDSTFAASKEAAGSVASFRAAMAFQGAKNVASDGSLATFPSWMSAVVAAGMQSAGFYKAIVNKSLNVSGIVHAAGDFNDQDDTQLEDALLSGLLPMRRDPTGGFRWVSDQTTYGKDSNFVFNSIQAVYVADIIALTTAQRMERAFVGQSVADVSAAVALTYLETIMGDFLRLKLIAPSLDAPSGFRNATIQISGGSMIVSVEVKLAGAIYFVPISFLVSQVQQAA